MRIINQKNKKSQKSSKKIAKNVDKLQLNAIIILSITIAKQAKGALIMKFEYSSPKISLEVLEKADVLLASNPGEQPSVNPKNELENTYFDISDFLKSPDDGWF